MRGRFLGRASLRWCRWAAIAASILVGGLLYVSWRSQIPVAGDLERLYIDGDRRALIIYHPTYIDDFQQQLTLRFAEGIAEAGWQVHRVTADPEAVAALELESYSAIVIGAHTYHWEMARPAQDSLEALPPLAGRNCAGIVSGLSSTEQAEDQLIGRLRVKGCGDVQVRPFWLMRPNDESGMAEDNRVIALDRAYLIGRSFGLRWSAFQLRD